MAEYKQIPVGKAEMSPQNVRKTEEDIDSLVESIRVVGVIEPVVAIQKDDNYEIVIGQRRTVAAQKAGIKEIPALVYNQSEYNPAQWRARSIIENEERTGLRDTDIEGGVKELVKELGSPISAAKALGWSEGKVRKWMKLEGLPDEVKKLMGHGLTTEDSLRLTDLMDKRPASEIIELAKELSKIKDRSERTKIVKAAKRSRTKIKTLKKKAKAAGQLRKLTILIDTDMMDGLTRAAEDLHVKGESDAAEKILDTWLEDHRYYSKG